MPPLAQNPLNRLGLFEVNEAVAAVEAAVGGVTRQNEVLNGSEGREVFDKLGGGDLEGNPSDKDFGCRGRALLGGLLGFNQSGAGNLELFK